MTRARQHGRRPGFTLVELLLAALCTAGVAGAGMTMVVAVSYGAGTMQSEGSAAQRGHSAIERMSKAVRTGRLVGFYDSDHIVLWTEDKNSDDAIQLSETEMYWLHAGTKELRRTRPYRASMTTGEIAATDVTLTAAELISPTSQTQITGSASAETTVLATKVTSLQIKGNDSPGAANLLDMRLTTTDTGVEKRFAACCTPRASADYLVNASDYKNDYVGARMRRANGRRWSVPTAAAVAW